MIPPLCVRFCANQLTRANAMIFPMIFYRFLSETSIYLHVRFFERNFDRFGVAHAFVLLQTSEQLNRFVEIGHFCSNAISSVRLVKEADAARHATAYLRHGNVNFDRRRLVSVEDAANHFLESQLPRVRFENVVRFEFLPYLQAGVLCYENRYRAISVRHFANVIRAYRNTGGRSTTLVDP